jgi:phosphatidylinositol alpha-1,6-mannosyltransferase
MKILFITPGCFDKGGISRYSRYQITALRELYGNTNVRVLSLLGPKKGDFEVPYEVYWNGKGADTASKIKLILLTCWVLIRWRPKIVHTAHINLSGFTHFLGKLSGATTILNIYGLEIWSNPSKDALYGLRRTDHVISDCYYTARYVKENNLREKNNVHVIWDCVDTDRFFPGLPDASVLALYKIPDPETHFNIVTLGRLSKTAAHKGYDRLIKAFAKLGDRFSYARLIIAGKGDNVDYYKDLARQENVFEKVVFTGMIAEKDLPDIYRSASVFSLVSDRGPNRGEGIPLTPLEAMACSIPILVGNQDGSQEAVIDNQNGFVLDPFDLERHAACIKELITNPALLTSKKEMAKKISAEFFSYSDFLKKTKVVYEKM